ncbi:MAG: signal peptidase I [Candidatus Aenigmarchaeota archaeon]|nr:signal peptidase I [Candidatus Aenigmarchaeota archaeon]
MRIKINLTGAKGTFFYIFLGVAMAMLINQGLAIALSTDMPVVAVESNSMVPTFYKGDILIIHGVSNPDSYKEILHIGDIIVFSAPGRDVPIVHRIVQINPDGSFQTMGDANNGRQLPFEKHIEPNQIHGKVIFVLPYLGWVKIGITEYVMPNIWIVALIAITVSFLYLINQQYR